MANFRGNARGPPLGPSTDLAEISNAPEDVRVKIPRLGFGTYQISAREAEAAVGTALKEGYRHIDTAQLYRNEAAVGRAVRASGIPREQVFVTTKLWNSDNGYENTLNAFHRSLDELGLDYIDLYLLHSPMRVDARLDSWRAMEDLFRSGRCRAIGVSNYGIHQMEELLQACTVRPAVNQMELHPFCTRPALVSYCLSHGIQMQAYSPLTKGNRLRDPTLMEMAARYQKSTAQLLIRWSLQKGYIVLPKSVTPSRIASNTQVYDFSISDIDMAKLDSLNEDYVTGWDPTKSP